MRRESGGGRRTGQRKVVQVTAYIDHTDSPALPDYIGSMPFALDAARFVSTWSGLTILVIDAWVLVRSVTV